MSAHAYDVQVRWSRGDTLHPRVTFSGTKAPSHTEIIELHHKAREECFIANSVTTDIRCEPLYGTRDNCSPHES
jgi:organic hydroperoxide reductase OsmC/OhrA